LSLWNDLWPVVVVSTREDMELLRAVVAGRCVPLMRQDISRLLFVIRHQMPFAIIIESNYLEEDALEVILNIRDVDKTIPVLIYGESTRALDNFRDDENDRHTVEVKSAKDVCVLLKRMRSQSAGKKYNKIAGNYRYA